MARLTDVRQGCGAAPQHQQSLARDPTRQETVVLARCASGGRAQSPSGAVALVYYHAAFHHGRGGDEERSSINSKNVGLPRFFPN